MRWNQPKKEFLIVMVRLLGSLLDGGRNITEIIMVIRLLSKFVLMRRESSILVVLRETQ
jgi:hypothetical protein